MIFLIAFCIVLFASVIFKFSILISMCVGLVLFVSYAFMKKFSAIQILKMCFSGIKTAKNILILLILLGFLTSLWRSSGTIAYIISISTNIIHPKSFILITFLLNCFISTLTGTAFGTAATMGAICMTISNSFGISQMWTGGAVLAGVYFGNRISPISSIALLTSSITKTDIYSNIKKMIPSTIAPFVISCLIYFFVGYFTFDSSVEINSSINIKNIFESNFNLNIFCLIPAILIIALSIFKVKVSINLLVSIFFAFVLSYFLQNIELTKLFDYMIFGFKPQNTELSKILSGGGFFSMFKVLIIVLIASIYGGIFKETKMLFSVKSKIESLSKKTNPFFSTLLTSIIASMIVCNQTLTIILTQQLCESCFEEKEKFSLALFNSAVVVAPLVPWSVAGGTALASANAPTESILCACFLYLVFILVFFVQIFSNRK